MSTDSGTSPRAMSHFESLARRARETNDYMPVWEAFVNTALFVVVLPVDEDDADAGFELAIFESEDGPLVHTTENIDGHQLADGYRVIKLLGGDLIQRVSPGVDIAVVMHEGAFCVPKEVVQWLKSRLHFLPSDEHPENPPLH